MRFAQVKEEAAKRPGDTEQNALPPGLRAIEVKLSRRVQKR